MVHFPSVALLVLLSAFPALAQQLDTGVSNPEQIKQDFVTVPCGDKERLGSVRLLLERAGAPASEITIDKYKDVENLVVIKKGQTAEKIVVGAHYDKVPDGCGALDNWTGIVALSHLYRTLKDFPSKKTLMFVAFGKEEKGLLGSRAMTKAIGKEQVAEYCAMINIDTLGLGPPQVADNMSSKKLTRLVTELAKEMKLPFEHANLPGGDSDSSSFVDKKIPAVTIHGMTHDWPKILHSRNDQVSRVNTKHVYLGYRLALATVVRLDGTICSAYK